MNMLGEMVVRASGIEHVGGSVGGLEVLTVRNWMLLLRAGQTDRQTDRQTDTV